MKGHLLHLFRYTRWANRQIIGALEALEHEAIPDHTLRLLGHIGRVQQVWLGRVHGAAQLPAIWGEDSLGEGRVRVKASTADWLDFLSDCAPDAFDRAVRYENSKGKLFRNELREIAAHVVNHSTHHRAQIAALIRKAGSEPPVTGYIFWARSGEADRRTPCT